jgi:hypothetical protein
MFRFTMKPSSGSHSEYLAKILVKYWLWLPGEGFIVNRNMLEQPPLF